MRQRRTGKWAFVDPLSIVKTLGTPAQKRLISSNRCQRSRNGKLGLFLARGSRINFVVVVAGDFDLADRVANLSRINNHPSSISRKITLLLCAHTNCIWPARGHYLPLDSARFIRAIRAQPVTHNESDRPMSADSMLVWAVTCDTYVRFLLVRRLARSLPRTVTWVVKLGKRLQKVSPAPN